MDSDPLKCADCGATTGRWRTIQQPGKRNPADLHLPPPVVVCSGRCERAMGRKARASRGLI